MRLHGEELWSDELIGGNPEEDAIVVGDESDMTVAVEDLVAGASRLGRTGRRRPLRGSVP
ncbi:hypothetical protein GBA52_008791 [Prunus armeniaca]|nr:hypothetical protein GBA52_008791 [Prunus armeniaca]